MALRDHIADVIRQYMVSPEAAADQILADKRVEAHFEHIESQKAVKRLREDYRCPTCGAEHDG